MTWLYFIGILILVGTLLYWLIIVTEGVYLGRRVVVWLYDKTARTYDQIKEFDQEFERESIGEPLLTYVAGLPEPLILDVATGTGRVPLLLLSDDRFQGKVIGVDAAIGMLSLARDKFESTPAEKRNQAMFCLQYAERLPFSNNRFDMVTCLEALEFFTSAGAALEEMVRVLRPGGLLMTTRRKGWEARFFFHRYHSERSLTSLLVESGLVNIDFYPWQVNYDMVMARKTLDNQTGSMIEIRPESERLSGRQED